MSSSSYRINKVMSARSMKSYLEVGVQHGHTFSEIDARTKVAVDPHFIFDTSSLEQVCNRYEETTSDIFFSSRNSIKDYDFVFLDGLHTFEQTLRDLNNALMSTHEDSVILIDDVWPSDMFSAIPDFLTCVDLREQVLHERIGTWQGDVFKLIFYIHDFIPTLSFVTVEPVYGNPQAFVIKRPRPDFQPLFGDIETISRLTYIDFLSFTNILNPMSEEDAIDWVLNSLGRRNTD